MDFTKHLDGTTLSMRSVRLTNKDIKNLISFLQEHQDIKKLDLLHNNIGAKGTKALAESPYLANLTELDLRFNNIGAEGAKALAESPYLANLTKLYLSDNNIGAEGVEALAEFSNPKRITIILDRHYQVLYNFLIESSSKTGELYKDSVKRMVFAVAQDNHDGTVIKYILKHPKKYPFLINSQDEQGHTLSRFYTRSDDMKKFLFEHGLIPKAPEAKDLILQNILRDTQSVHASPVVKQTNFIVKELVESRKDSAHDLEQAATSYQEGIPELLELYQNDQVRLGLLSLTEGEKRSVMEKTHHGNTPVPNDKEFVEAVISKTKQTLEKQYLRKKENGQYDAGYPTQELQYDYTESNEKKITIPQSIGYIKLLIDGFDIPLDERKELLVTFAEQNPKLMEQKLSYIKSELKNDDIIQEQVTERSEFHKLLNGTTDKSKIDELFKEISGLDLKEIWKEQKAFVLAKQIYVAATTYGENNSACIQGTWSQIINGISEISPELMNKYHDHLEEKSKKEKQKEVITATNIGEFEEALAETLIQYVKEHPELKDALDDFALSMVNITKPEEITHEHQEILAKINQEFSKIKDYLPNYNGDIPANDEYKIIIEKLSAKKMKLFFDESQTEDKINSPADVVVKISNNYPQQTSATKIDNSKSSYLLENQRNK